MLDFFTNMQPLQLVLVGIGLILVFPHIVEMVKKRMPKAPLDRLVLDDPDHNLTELVCQWEQLCNACEDLGLKEASAKLEEVFPLLVKGRKKPNPPEPVTIEE